MIGRNLLEDLVVKLVAVGRFIPYAQYVTLSGIEFYFPNLVVLNHRTTLKQIIYIESTNAFSFLAVKHGALLCGGDS